MKKIILFFILSISFIFAQDYQVLLGIENLDEVANTFDIKMRNFEDIGGFQIVFENIQISAASGGTAGANGFMLSASVSMIMGFSFTGGTIVEGEGVLLTVAYTDSYPEVGASFNINTLENCNGSDCGTRFSDAFGENLVVEEYFEGLNGYWCVESDFDECDICYLPEGHMLYEESYAYEEDSACTGCMESDAENFNVCSYVDSDGTTEVTIDCTIACLDCCAAASDVLGCMDSLACNYNADATVDGDDLETTDIDESCWSANEGCTCSDAEGSAVDCAGTCDGSAEEDCAGVCTGDSVIDACNICGGTGMDDCGECPGEDNLYGYTGTQAELGGENSTCTGCMDDTASNYNSTVGDPIQQSNECSGDDGCAYDCAGILDGLNTDCCYYALDISLIDIMWDVTIVQDTTTIEDFAGVEISVPAVYMKVEDLTDLSEFDFMYRSIWFHDDEDPSDDIMINHTANTEESYFFTDVNYGDSTNTRLQIINNVGQVLEISETFELKTLPDLLSINSLPNQIWLSNNYPNPFNPVTSISYSVERAGQVNISIYNLLGSKVYDLVSGYHIPGAQYSVTWNSNTQSNIPVSTGIYFYEMRSGNYIERKKMVLVK